MESPQSLSTPVTFIFQVLNIILMILILYWDVFFIFNEGGGSTSSALLTLVYWTIQMILVGIIFVIGKGVEKDDRIYYLAIVFVVLALSGIPLNFLALNHMTNSSNRLTTAIFNHAVPILVASLNFYVLRDTKEE